MSLTPRICTANSMAAAVELVLPVTVAGGTMLPAFLTTNKSPGWLCVTNSANTRESEQVMNNVCGFWPSRDSRANSSRYRPNSSRRNLCTPSMSRCIPGQILDSSLAESAPPLGALVAPATMPAAFRGEARETQLQRQMPAALDNLRLGKSTERRDHADARYAGKVPEELRRRVGKRIVPERADGNHRYIVQRAEHSGFRQQHQVSAGKIDGCIARLRTGNTP